MMQATFKLKHCHLRSQTKIFTSYKELVKDIYTWLCEHDNCYIAYCELNSWIQYFGHIVSSLAKKENFSVDEINPTEEIAKEFLGQQQKYCYLILDIYDEKQLGF